MSSTAFEPAVSSAAVAASAAQDEAVAASLHYRTRLGIWSKVVVVWAFVMIVAGALITANKAALSDATWPLFSGNWYPKYWKGGLLYEDGHRVTGAGLGVLLAIFVTFVMKDERRRRVRWLAWLAVLLVVVQAVFGGLVIHSIRTIPISMTHASLAELFLLNVVTLGLFESKGWLRLRPLVERTGATAASGSELAVLAKPYLRLATWAVPLAFLQVVLGSGIRHADRSSDAAFYTFLALHFAVYVCVIFVIAGLSFSAGQLVRLLETERGPGAGRLARPLQLPAWLAAALAFSQAGLGVLSYFANRARQEDQLPLTTHVLVSTVHLAVGATILATLLVLALRARRLLMPETQRPDGLPKQFS